MPHLDQNGRRHLSSAMHEVSRDLLVSSNVRNRQLLMVSASFISARVFFASMNGEGSNSKLTENDALPSIMPELKTCYELIMTYVSDIPIVHPPPQPVSKTLSQMYSCGHCGLIPSKR